MERDKARSGKKDEDNTCDEVRSEDKLPTCEGDHRKRDGNSNFLKAYDSILYTRLVIENDLSRNRTEEISAKTPTYTK